MRRIIHIIALVLILIGCERNVRPDNLRTPVNVITSIGENESKAPVIGSDFSNGDTYGLFICQAFDYDSGNTNTYKPHSLGYNNIRARLTVETTDNLESRNWAYNFAGSSTSFPSLFINSERGDSAADIFAYAPWISGVKNPEEIEFLIDKQEDIMYAAQNAQPGINKNLSTSEESHTVHLNFEHVLSLLEIEFAVSNTTAAPMKLNKIVVSRYREKDESGAITFEGPELYTKAKLNAVTGDLSLIQTTASSFTVGNLNLTSDTGFRTTRILLIPYSIPDKNESGIDNEHVYNLGFYFNDAVYPIEYTIKRTDIIHGGDNAPVGFQPGYRYKFRFTFENYLHLDKVTIDREWKNGGDVNIYI